MLTGSLHLLFLYDVADEIRLDGVARALGLSAETREPVSGPPHAHYVHFENPPLLEPLRDEGDWRGCLRYYEYGIVSVTFQLPFSCDWRGLVEHSHRWLGSAEMERRAAAHVDDRVRRIQPHLDHPYPARSLEDYSVVQIEATQEPMQAEELRRDYRDEIAQIVRGETSPLSDAETAEVMEASISYFPDDLLVVGWSTAFLYDTADAADLTIRLLEYANVQLLEFRHYDEVLSRLLRETYKSLERKGRSFQRWKLAREAAQLNTLLLDVREITERMDNSVKFLSDMFSARLYRLAAQRIGVPDYRKLVEDKLADATDAYGSMIERFNHARAFVLESIVVIILVVELIALFRGKT